MASTDSVSVFAEGTFEEQIQELVGYILRGLPEDNSAPILAPFREALQTTEGQKSFADDEDRRRQVFTLLLNEVKGFGDGSEREIEGFFNLIYSHLFSLYPSSSAELKQFLTQLVQVISSAPPEQTYIKYRLLSNIFNALPRTSPLRLLVFQALLETATSNNEINPLQLSQEKVETWLKEWDISSEEKSRFLLTISEAYTKVNEPTTSYEYLLLYLRSLPSTSPAAHDAAVNAMATALRLPSAFDFDALFKIDAVMAAKDHELFSLLRIFLNDGLPEFTSWADSHSSTFDKFALDRTQLERKIRLLTLASLGFKNVGQKLSYSKVAEALQVDPSQVEMWVIDVIRTGLLSGKMSQTAQTLHIVRSTPRVFEREQWEALEKRILAWKAGLTSVLAVVSDAKKQGGIVSSPAVAASA